MEVGSDPESTMRGLNFRDEDFGQSPGGVRALPPTVDYSSEHYYGS